MDIDSKSLTRLTNSLIDQFSDACYEDENIIIPSRALLAEEVLKLLLEAIRSGGSLTSVDIQEILCKAVEACKLSTQQVYRIPIHMLNYHTVIGGRRHGKKHGLPVESVDLDDSTVRVRITVKTPVNTQLQLGVPWKLTSSVDKPDVPNEMARMVAANTGPSVSVMGHILFRLAFKHAAEECRAADGRFWFAPHIVADEFGIPRQSAGNGLTRIGKESTQSIRKNFELYVHTEIHQDWTDKRGRRHSMKGQIAHLTTKEHYVRTPGVAGRDGRVEWQILKELWDLTKSYYAIMPDGLLNAMGERQDVWAKAIRIYEVLAVQARNNARNAATGEPWVLSMEELLKKANVFPEKTRPRNELADVAKLLEMLAKRNFLVFSTAALKDGRNGIQFRLPEDRVMELARVEQRRRLLSAGSGPSKKRRTRTVRGG